MDKDYDKIITDLVYDKINYQTKKEFIPGTTYIPPSGFVRNAEGYVSMVKAVLDGNWTEGKYATAFGNSLKDFVGVKYPILVNSGSSANLLAVTALFNPKKPKWISCATGFPTTVNPVLQNGGELILVDAILDDFNANTKQILSLLDTVSDIGGVIMAHTLGFPFDVELISEKCKELDVFLIEDCCDALGTEVLSTKGKDWVKVGTFGDCSTYSFYPAHHICSIEGGAILTDNEPLARKIKSLRDWGKSCYCPPGVDNVCGKRFEQEFEGLPKGYDHKYVYSNIGYNLKMTDIQAALGYSQILMIDELVQKRVDNYYKLLEVFDSSHMVDYLFIKDIFFSVVSPFGVPITVFGDVTRQFIKYLEYCKIGTRPVFAGNLIRQPAYQDHPKISTPFGTRNSDYILNHSFWIGCHPNITEEMLDYMVFCIKDYWSG